MYTINLPFNGGAVMNGLGWIRVFQSELEAQAYLREKFPNDTRGLAVTPIHLVGLDELV